MLQPGEVQEALNIIGKLSVEPMNAYRQNDEVVMARVVTRYSGDTWINVHLADVGVWETDAHESTDQEPAQDVVAVDYPDHNAPKIPTRNRRI